MASPPPIDFEKIRESSDGSVTGFARLAFKEAIASNPYFAAGGGLMVLGTGFGISPSGSSERTGIFVSADVGRLGNPLERQAVPLVFGMDGAA